MDLITLADLPELAGSDKAPKSTIVVARLDDKLYDPRYGRFEIGQSDVDGWRRNLAETFGGRVSIDFDHSSDRGKGTKAAAWITAIGQQGKTVTADVEWTPSGAQSVRDGDYRYISPTFVSNFVDEHKESHGKALIGAALTNRPVLRKGMPCLSLSRDELEGVATLSTGKRERKRARAQLARVLASDSDAPRDSRPQMDKLAELRKALSLEDDADHATVLAAVEALDPDAEKAQRKADKKARKLSKQAKAEGDDTVTLSQMDDERFAQLLLDANAGASAAKQLAENTFNAAWEKALTEGRAAPSQEENLRELHEMNPALAIKTLDSFVKIVPTRPAGSGDNPNTGPAPLGMDDDRFALHTQAKALAAEKLKADPKLDEAEAYTLAAIEIEERKFALENPGI